MGMRIPLAVFVAFLTLAVFVSADPVRVLYADGCGWVDGTPLTCTSSKYVACNVSDTNGDGVKVNSVTFNINGYAYAASLYSGNTTNGVWRATVDKTYGQTSMNIDNVAITNSIGWSCAFSPTVTNPLYQSGTPYSCYISFQGRTETVEACTGTPNVCSTYTNSSTCGATGCTWLPSVAANTPASVSTANSGSWNNPSAVNALDGNPAYSAGATGVWTGYNGTLPLNAVVRGMTLRARSSAGGSKGTHQIYYAIGNGTSFGTQVSTGDISTGWADQTWGSNADKWGLSFGNPANVQVRAIASSGRGYNLNIDYLEVVVYYDVAEYCGGSPSVCQVYTSSNASCTQAGCSYAAPIGSTIKVAGWCPCEVTTTTQKLSGSPDQCVTTWTPSAGCEGSTVTSSTTYCDWCDPGWEVSYGACEVNRQSADPFSGYAVKKYTTTNSSCCVQTGLDTDCNPPSDADSNVACVLDYYATYGGNAELSSHDQKGNSLNSPIAYTTTMYADAYGPTVLRPLAFDFDEDGKTDLMTFGELSGQGRVAIYDDPELSEEKMIFALEVDNESESVFSGQPSLFGFSSWGDEAYTWNPDVLSGAAGAGYAMVLFDKNTTNYRFAAYRYEGGSFVQKSSYLTVVSPGAGVNCIADDCFFLDGNGDLQYRNALGAVSYYGSNSSSRSVGQSTGSTYTGSVPAFISFNNELDRPTALAVKGKVSGNAAAIFCPMNLTSIVACDSVVTDVDIEEMSNIVVKNVSADGTVNAFFTTYENQVSKLWKVVVNQTSSAMDVISYESVSLSAIGGYSDCVSNVAKGYCMGGSEGVVLASHWVYPSGNSTGYNEYTCYTDDMDKSFAWIEREDYCPRSIIAQELAWDETSAIISASGIFGNNQRFASFNGATNESAVIMVDLTGSTYTGVTTVSESVLRNIVSTIPVNAITTTDHVSIQSADCYFNPGPKTVSITPRGVTAPKKEFLEFHGSYSTDQGGSGQDGGWSSSVTRTMSAPKSGLYTLNVRARDRFTGEVADASCVVGVVIPETVVQATSCSVGENNVDGSFNYNTPITQNGWILGALTSPELVETRYLTFKQADGYQGRVYHPLACNDQRVRIEARVRAPVSTEDAGTDSRIILLARSGIETTSTIVPMGMVSIIRSTSKPYVTVVAESTTRTVVYQQNGTTVNWLIIGIEVDRITGQAKVDVQEETANGTVQGQQYTVSVVNAAQGQFAGVEIDGAHQFYVDYIKISNQSGIIIPLVTSQQMLKQEAANTYLYDPATRTTKCLGVDQSQNYSVDARMSFNNVKRYCDRISNTVDHQDNPGYCTFKDLQEVVTMNSQCYLEAYAYCVNVTYLRSSGFYDSGFEDLTNTGEVLDLEMESTGGDGAGICASTLGLSVVASKQALPFMNVMWSLMVDYWVYLLVFIVAIIVIGGMGGGGQEGG